MYSDLPNFVKSFPRFIKSCCKEGKMRNIVIKYYTKQTCTHRRLVFIGQLVIVNLCEVCTETYLPDVFA